MNAVAEDCIVLVEQEALPSNCEVLEPEANSRSPNGSPREVCSRYCEEILRKLTVGRGEKVCSGGEDWRLPSSAPPDCGGATP